MSTECPHCHRKFVLFVKYAEHILAKHPDDEIRVSWAQDVLAPKPEPEEVSVPDNSNSETELDATLKTILKPEVYKKLKER